jgi:hypothetical protein
LSALADDDPDVVLAAIETLCVTGASREAVDAIEKVRDGYEHPNRVKRRRVRKAAESCLKK